MLLSVRTFEESTVQAHQTKRGSLHFTAGGVFPTDAQLDGKREVVVHGPVSRDEVSNLKRAQTRFGFDLAYGDEEAKDALDPPEE